MSPVSRRRLEDLRNGLLLPRGTNLTELDKEHEDLGVAICAGQSLDDLGEELNVEVNEAIDTLLARYKEVEREITEAKKQARAALSNVTKRDGERLLTAMYRLSKGRDCVSLSKEEIDEEIKKERLFAMTDEEYKTYCDRVRDEVLAFRATLS